MTQIIYLMGPTASGKTDCAIELLQHLPCEIISVDSAMIYRGMDVGTAKPTPDVLQEAPHHLIDIRNPDENYSVAEFCQDANALIQGIQSRGKIPLLVGGTIMYFHALQFGLSELPSADPEIRLRLEQQAADSGWPELHKQLAKIDPESAAKIHPNDPQRLQRALEVYELTGVKLSSWQASRTKHLNLQGLLNFGLFPENRAELHQRIAARFEQMLEFGVIEELQKLQNQWQLHSQMPSMRCIGYRQIWTYLEGEISHEQMCDQAIAATRQLAKRQLTWLRHYPDVSLFDTSSCSTKNIIGKIISQSQRTSW